MGPGAGAEPLLEGGGFFREASDQLVAYAKHFFGLAKREPDGSTLRAHYAKAAKKGIAPAIEALREPRYPAALRYLWDWFMELHQHRGIGMNGPAALSWQDFDAWARLTGRKPTAWELGELSRLDNAFFSAANQPETKKKAE
jgi:hypothetical protein